MSPLFPRAEETSRLVQDFTLESTSVSFFTRPRRPSRWCFEQRKKKWETKNSGQSFTLTGMVYVMVTFLVWWLFQSSPRNAVEKSKLGISGISAQLFRSMTNVAGCCYVIKVFSLDPPRARAEAVIISRLDDAPIEDLHQQGDWTKPRASPPVKQAAVCRGERKEHKLRRRWPEFAVFFPSLLFVSNCSLCFGENLVRFLAGPSRDFRPTTSCSLKSWAKINVHCETQRWESAS